MTESMPVEYCGLDFGTSNSTLSLIRDGRPVLGPLEDENVTLPSAVFFDFEDHKVRYGRDGIRAYIEGSEGRLLRGLKSVLGSQLIGETTLVQRKRVEMRSIIGMFVRHLKAAATCEIARRGGPGGLGRRVLGPPARFVGDDGSAGLI